MENHLIPVDSIFRNYNDFTKSNPFIYYLPNSLKNISYVRLSSVELPKIIPQFSQELGNNFFEVARDLPSGSLNNIFVSEKVILEEGFYEKDNLLSNPNLSNKINLETNPSSILSNFKIELVNINGFNQIKISADDNFTLNFGTHKHPYSYQVRSIVASNVSVKESKNYTQNNVYYDSLTKEVYKFKINSISSLNNESTNILNGNLNLPILTNNSSDLKGNKKNFNIRIPPLGYYLGFRYKFYTGSNVYYSEAEPNLYIIKYLLVKVNNYGHTPTNHEDDQYLAKIIVKNQEMPTFDNESNKISKRCLFNKPRDVDELKISIHDPYGNIIDFNNQDFSLTVELGLIQNSDLRNQYREGMP
ncbi:hypothetical protein crov400 [Cafeteria roenbergensis virus]|uniref:Uncharacterized protein n=1 Tax=Cafeteria roenbergensis virus (strain BV-PW1) TaxID=693272 RepID=E3T5H1_CROVB|nr:hypothetical protein crov400 [Cafeteria roenbergensis virus BV-PW1]ADO67434.1 hypothetical protein crov400 [Cafeteria roenbergensis virus BV-PW1]